MPAHTDSRGASKRCEERQRMRTGWVKMKRRRSVGASLSQTGVSSGTRSIRDANSEPRDQSILLPVSMCDPHGNSRIVKP